MALVNLLEVFFFFLFIMFRSFSGQGRGCIWHSTGGPETCEDECEVCGEDIYIYIKKNGCYDVKVHHPNSTGIKSCTSTTVLCVSVQLFFFPLSFLSLMARPLFFLYVKEKQNTGL